MYPSENMTHWRQICQLLFDLTSAPSEVLQFLLRSWDLTGFNKDSVCAAEAAVKRKTALSGSISGGPAQHSALLCTHRCNKPPTD